MRRLRVAAALLAALLPTAGCQLSQLAHLEFVKDNRLSFTSPAARSLVATPFTVSWTMRDFDASGADGRTVVDAGQYAVFVDLAPIAVGRTLRDVGKDDTACKRDPTCPNAAYLRARGVYLTTTPSVQLTILPKPDKGVGDEQHEATVILLDGTGVRRTESAWHVEFRFPRRPS